MSQVYYFLKIKLQELPFYNFGASSLALTIVSISLKVRRRYRYKHIVCISFQVNAKSVKINALFTPHFGFQNFQAWSPSEHYFGCERTTASKSRMKSRTLSPSSDFKALGPQATTPIHPNLETWTSCSDPPPSHTASVSFNNEVLEFSLFSLCVKHHDSDWLWTFDKLYN